MDCNLSHALKSDDRYYLILLLMRREVSKQKERDSFKLVPQCSESLPCRIDGEKYCFHHQNQGSG